MPGQIKIDDGAGNYTVLTNGGSLGSDKTITIPNTTGTMALTSDISGGKVLQYVSATASTEQSTTSTSLVDNTGMTVNITPSSASNKVLILYTDNGSTNRSSDTSTGNITFSLLRDTTQLTETDAGYYDGSGNASRTWYGPLALNYVDSPNTTSQVTYKIQFKAASNGTAKTKVFANTATIIAVELDV